MGQDRSASFVSRRPEGAAGGRASLSLAVGAVRPSDFHSARPHPIGQRDALIMHMFIETPGQAAARLLVHIVAKILQRERRQEVTGGRADGLAGRSNVANSSLTAAAAIRLSQGIRPRV